MEKTNQTFQSKELEQQIQESYRFLENTGNHRTEDIKNVHKAINDLNNAINSLPKVEGK